MKLLFIPPPGPGSDLRSGVWPGLADHAHIDVLPVEHPAELLAKHGEPLPLSDCLRLAEPLIRGRYDYVVGHANALLWLAVFRMAGSDLPFAVVPNYNHVQPYDIFVLALAAQFRAAGDVLFTGSRASARAFERFGFQCHPYHAPGIPLTQFQHRPAARPKVRKRMGIDAQAPVMLYTGRLDADKSVRSLIKAQAEINAATGSHLIIAYHAGAPSYVELCRASAAAVPRVHFIQDASARELEGLYNASDLFVLSGVSDFETFGRSPLEAMACGAVPVVPAFDGFFENIPREAGVLVPTYGDPSARRCRQGEFARAVIELLGDRARMAAMRERSMGLVAAFDSPVCVRRFCELIGSGASRARTASGDETWRNELLPPELRPMTSALADKPRREVLADFLATREPRLEAVEQHLAAYRRAWFSSFFPDVSPAS